MLLFNLLSLSLKEYFVKVWDFYKILCKAVAPFAGASGDALPKYRGQSDSLIRSWCPTVCGRTGCKYLRISANCAVFGKGLENAVSCRTIIEIRCNFKREAKTANRRNSLEETNPYLP
jgi:hypothetical protein